MKKRLSLLASVLAGLALVVFFLIGNLRGAVNITPNVGTNELTDLHYPFRYFLSQSLREGQLPLWSSAISSGFPLFADGQIGALYPLNLLAAYFDTTTSINITLVCSFFFLFLLSFLYLSKIRLFAFPAFFGASIITFSGFAVGELVRFPMVVSFYLFVGQLYFLEVFLQGKKKEAIWVLLMGVLLGLSLLGGHPQVIFYSLIFLFFYWMLFWYRRKEATFSFIPYFALFVFCGFAIGAVQVLPEAELMLHSSRSAGLAASSINQYSFPLSNLADFIAPQATFDGSHTFSAFINNGWPADERYVYLGLLGLVLAAFALLRLKKYTPYSYIFLATAGIALLLSFGSQLTVGYILTLMPFSFFRIPFRLIFLVSFSLGVLAAFSMQELQSGLEKIKISKAAVFGISGAVILFSFINLKIAAVDLHPSVDTNSWYKKPQVATFLQGKLSDQERVTTEYYFYPSLKIFLEKPDLWGDPDVFINLRNLLPVFNNLMYGIPENVGIANSGGLKLDRYNELEYEIFYNGISYPDINTLKLSDSFLFLNRLMGVRFVLLTEPVQNDLLTKAFQVNFQNGQDPVYVYEFTDYFPRVFMVPKAEKAAPADIKARLLKGDFDPKNEIFVDDEDKSLPLSVFDGVLGWLDSLSGRSAAEVKSVDHTTWKAQGGYAATALFTKYTDQKIDVSTQASGNGYLFLSDTYYPGWKAYVDGRETKILRADYAFRAVPVPEGKHSVVFTYDPDSFYFGVRISIFALAGVAGAILVITLKAKIWIRRN